MAVSLLKAKDTLEKRVRERTEELLMINKRLDRENKERIQSERKCRMNERKLRSLASELLLVEERERRKIAVGLHDHIGHGLANVSIKLSQLKQEARSEGLESRIQEIGELLKKISQDTQSLTFELSPPVLYDLGLEAALDWLAEKNEREHGIVTEFSDDRQSKPLDVSAKLLLFHATRELLFNVIKHAGAKKIIVSIKRVGNEVRVAVEDDGRGINIEKINFYKNKRAGFGLFSIQERLSTINGRLVIKGKTGTGKGTQVVMAVPMQLKH